VRLRRTCKPWAYSNQPAADKSPAKKPAGKSRPDQLVNYFKRLRIILKCFFCGFWLPGTPLPFEQFFLFSNLLKIFGAKFYVLIEPIRPTNILFSISDSYYSNAPATTFAFSRQSFGNFYPRWKQGGVRLNFPKAH